MALKVKARETLIKIGTGGSNTQTGGETGEN